MAEKKITKREMFAQLREMVADNEDMVAFIDHEIELLSKKRATGERKPTKTQIANEKYTAELVDFLMVEDKPLTIKEIKGGIDSFTADDLSNQKITHLLTPLIKDGRVEKTVEKGTNYYRLVA